jgi:hypothetical protein
MVQEATESGPIDPTAQMRIGVASCAKAEGTLLGQVTFEGPVPRGAQDLQVGVEAADNLGASFDQT